MAQSNRVLVIRVEDHVSPVLKAIDDMQLLIPSDAVVPRLPDEIVALSTAELGSTVGLTMRPSAALLTWLADVRKVSISATKVPRC